VGIGRDDAILDGEPRIEGTRIGVRHVAARAVDGGQTPAYVADQLDITLAAVYEARSYGDATRDKSQAFEDATDEAFERVRASSLTPRAPVE
jgi:uncharacterized protein (DUF433 family)